jgi:hypothetical protein
MNYCQKLQKLDTYSVAGEKSWKSTICGKSGGQDDWNSINLTIWRERDKMSHWEVQVNTLRWRAILIHYHHLFTSTFITGCYHFAKKFMLYCVVEIVFIEHHITAPFTFTWATQTLLEFNKLGQDRNSSIKNVHSCTSYRARYYFRNSKRKITNVMTRGNNASRKNCKESV